MHYALHTTSPRALQRAAEAHADRALATHWDAEDRADLISTLSFRDLQALRDDCSEQSAWRSLEEIDCELRARRAVAVARLMARFIEQAKVGGVLPCVAGKELGSMLAAEWIREQVQMAVEVDAMAMLVLQPGSRDALLARWARDWALDHCDGLLAAGWEA